MSEVPYIKGTWSQERGKARIIADRTGRTGSEPVALQIENRRPTRCSTESAACGNSERSRVGCHRK